MVLLLAMIAIVSGLAIFFSLAGHGLLIALATAMLGGSAVTAIAAVAIAAIKSRRRSLEHSGVRKQEAQS